MAPALVLPDAHGRPFALADAWSRGPVVLFFYPRAGTLICTKEACAFRDAHEQFRSSGATVIGISRDDPEAQQRFAQQHGLPYPLLCDVDGRAHAAFGVRGALGLGSARVTYVIAPAGRIIGRYQGRLAWERHVRRALATLDQRSG